MHNESIKKNTNRKDKMTKNDVKEIIKNKINLKYASRWYSSSEKLLEFDHGFNTDHLGIVMSDNEDLFEFAFNIFELRCEILFVKLMEEEVKKLSVNA